MRMKKIFAVLLLSLVCLAGRAAPAPPQFLGLANPTNGFFMTNITFVFTNVAMVTQTAFFPQVTVFSGSVFNVANTLSWMPTADPTVSFKIYYGAVTGTTTNNFVLQTNISSISFFSVLNTNLSYWAYVTALDTNGNESVPSGVISFTPTR